MTDEERDILKKETYQKRPMWPVYGPERRKNMEDFESVKRELIELDHAEYLLNILRIYRDRLKEVKVTLPSQIPKLEKQQADGAYTPKAQFMAFDGAKYIVVDNRQGQFEKETKETLHDCLRWLLHKQTRKERERWK